MTMKRGAARVLQDLPLYPSTPDGVLLALAESVKESMGGSSGKLNLNVERLTNPCAGNVGRWVGVGVGEVLVRVARCWFAQYTHTHTHTHTPKRGAARV